MKERKEQLADNVFLYCGDSAELLATVKRAHKIDAVVTDPPFGISADRHRGSQANGWTDHGMAEGWDAERPPESLMRGIIGLGKPTIIWGGNYFIDWLSTGAGQQNKWLIWDKCQEDFSLADAELAWCSFDGAIRRIGVSRGAALQDGKEHPTQKSLKVMQWCIDQQLPKLKKGAIIFDPFAGSFTTGVAAVSLGYGFVGIEREQHYFEVGLRRMKKELSQEKLF